jgi:iron complex transport system substrate-binding protein
MNSKLNIVILVLACVIYYFLGMAVVLIDSSSSLSSPPAATFTKDLSPTTTQATTQTTTPTLLQITDQADRPVTLDNTNPQKIISLSPSNTEILFALGLGDRVVGVTQWCNYPAAALDKPKIGGFSETTIDVSIEQIVAIGPDLILATETHLTEVVPKLEEFLPGAAILVLLTQTESFDVVFEAINLVGECTGTEAAAARVVDDMSQRIKVITDITGTLTDAERPGVFYIVWHDPIFAIGGGTLGNTLIEAAGGVNIFEDTTGSFMADLETIIDRNPEVILGSSAVGAGADLPYQFALTDERLSGVDARLNNRVYGTNDDIYGRPGPRLVEALEELAALLHPELFP